MRIIHEIDFPMQVSVGLHPYRSLPGTGGYSGARVEILMTTSPVSNFRDDANLVEPLEEETIDVEGPLEIVLDAFRQVVEMLEDSKAAIMEDKGKPRLLGCPDCSDGTGGLHNWECLAKRGNESAKKVIASDPSLVEAQRYMASKEAAKWGSRHADCGGVGCADCEWTGAV